MDDFGYGWLFRFSVESIQCNTHWRRRMPTSSNEMSMYYMWQHFEIEMSENFARNMAAKWFFIWLLLIYVVIVDRRRKVKKKKMAKEIPLWHWLARQVSHCGAIQYVVKIFRFESDYRRFRRRKCRKIFFQAEAITLFRKYTTGCIKFCDFLTMGWRYFLATWVYFHKNITDNV